MRRASLHVAAAAAVIAIAAGGCGAPDEMSRKEALALADAREHLDDAVDTEETLRTSKADARRLRAEVQKIVSGGYFEGKHGLDEFGLAALGELQQVVPSLVEVDEDGVPTDLDRRGTRAFLRFAETDPRRALVGPVTGEVKAIEKEIEASDADGDTVVPSTAAADDQNVAEYLREAERDLAPIWPALAKRLRETREEL